MDLPNDLLIDAKSLRNNNVQKRQIKEILIDILRQIDDELKTAHNEGRYELTTELPILFGITHMSEKSAQRAIWFKVIEYLKNKNYTVSIDPRSDTCILRLTWFSTEDVAEIIHQNNIITLHTKKI